MTSELFVWIYLPMRDAPVVAGRIEIAPTAANAVGYFTYGRSYLNRPDAIPIDPVALPLRKGEIPVSDLGGYPAAVLDACPDTWGIRVINRLVGQREIPRGYLLLNDPGRAGCLAFSESPDQPPVELASREFPLADLLAAAEAVESDGPVDQELLKALHPGTGGARPKCNILEGDAVWIAKFPSADDKIISIPRLEHATMSLARRCGIDASETRLRKINGRDICLVKRFDRVIANGRIYRKGFLSARTIFHADPNYARVGTGSYQRIARWMPRFGVTRDARLELFRRLVFNVAIRNDDDHELNHGLVHLERDAFTLSSAYDLVPGLNRHEVHRHALLIGESGAGTVENLLSVSDAFGLSRDEARRIVTEIETTVLDRWQESFYEAGFGDEDLHKLADVFRRILE
jgi:serine/threonine-protein kinase HipA